MSEGQTANAASEKSQPMSEPIFLKDYRPSVYLIERVDLVFDLFEDKTVVTNTMLVYRNKAKEVPSFQAVGDLHLDGEHLHLISVSVDGQPLTQDAYLIHDSGLTLFNLPERCEICLVTHIDPASNLALEGLYLSDGMYCTQCEAEGFRRISYYLDRPDVMAVFTTKIIASEKLYPVLLANGNKIAQGSLPDGRHWVEWHDPFKKPCYLFAMVAGNLQVVEDSFTTMSGRHIDLQIFVEQKDVEKCGHAMLSLQRAMRWDEQVYGREYDLDLYMIVAVDFFNMGAMENKGLNIFNTSCVLAHPSTQTDMAFQRVEGVVAHEYFHNWSGNRVTCRDWFQLSLKEGFTVFRDACFSADMNSATVKRIEDVSLLRSAQFAEDAGPLAHPVRPESFIEISNFYTLTIYEKGAELVRMLHELLGAELFRKGTDLYFDRHDGQAVTCEDFVVALEDASGYSLAQFRRWYSQAGTPTLQVSENWNPQKKSYTLTITQSCAPSPDQDHKEPFYLPIKMALLGPQGLLASSEQVLVLAQQSQSWTFDALDERPVVSLLRGFSAPVKLMLDYSYSDLLHLINYETDGFARWDAAKRYMMKLIEEHVAGSSSLNSELGAQRTRALATVLEALLLKGFEASSTSWDVQHDAAMLASLLELPEFSYIIEQFDEIKIAEIDDAVSILRAAMAEHLHAVLTVLYRNLNGQLSRLGQYQPIAEHIALRKLKNTCLHYLMVAPTDETLGQVVAQFNNADNMTEQAAALSALTNCDAPAAQAVAEQALQSFYQQWQSESLVVNQWLSVQVGGDKPGALQRLHQLLEHPAYDNTNPNKVRALLGAFCMRNLPQFHAADGKAYALLAAEIIRLDGLNPQLAARLLAPMTRWSRFCEPQRGLMRASLEQIAATDNLSADVFEVVSKTLVS